MVTTTAFGLQNVVTAPWGEGPGEIPSILQDRLQFAEAAPNPVGKVRAPVRIRLDPRGGLHVLAAAGAQTYLHHFDPRGAFSGRTPISAGHSGDADGTLSDFAVDADGACYLLEALAQADPPVNRLRCLTEAGDTIWSRSGPLSPAPADFEALGGRFRRLLIDGRSRVHLVGETGGAIARLDRRSGATTMTGRFAPGGEDLFMAPDGLVGFVYHVADVNRRGLGLYDPDADALRLNLVGADAFGWLLYPVGLDSSHRLHAWQDGAVARIAPDGRITPIAAFDAIVVRAEDGSIFTSRALLSEGRAVVQTMWHGPADPGRTLDLALPAEAAGPRGWRLVHVDAMDRLHLYGGEGPGNAGSLLIYSGGGELEEVRPAPGDLLDIEARMQGHSDWQVDGEGRLYVPVLAPDGLRIVRVADRPA